MSSWALSLFAQKKQLRELDFLLDSQVSPAMFDSVLDDSKNEYQVWVH